MELDDAYWERVGKAVGPQRVTKCFWILRRISEEVTDSMNPEKFAFVCSQLDKAISLMRVEMEDEERAWIKRLEQLHRDTET